jgi:L-malate glycosyltransferase
MATIWRRKYKYFTLFAIYRNNKLISLHNNLKLTAHKNILFIPAWYPNDSDNQLGVFVHKHAKSVARFHRVVVIYVRSSNETHIKKSVKDDITIIESTYQSSGFNIFSNRYYQAFKNAMSELPADFLPDIIHTHVLDKNVLAANKFYPTTPKIHTEHWSGFLTGEWSKIPFFKRVMLKVAMQSSAYKTAVSSLLYEKVDAIFPKIKGTVIPNVIEHCGNLAQAFQGGKLKILTVADLTEEVKNISGIIEICCLIEDDIQLEWTIIGSGPDEDFLHALTEHSELKENRIKFVGRLSNDVVLNEIPKFHLMVNMSHYETFGMAICEGIASGVPVISTAVGVAPEIINPKNGRLVNSTKQAADIILQYYKQEIKFNPEEVKSTLPEDYSMKNIGENFDKIYREILS